jgi:hypothetical protein
VTPLGLQAEATELGDRGDSAGYISALEIFFISNVELNIGPENISRLQYFHNSTIFVLSERCIVRTS